MGKKITIFLDGGSTQTFAKASVFEKDPQLIKPLEPFAVKIANGQILECSNWVTRLSWEMQGHRFSLNVYILNIEPYDLILGVDWMRAHCPITFDFRNLQLNFDKQGQQVLLQGDIREGAIKILKGKEAHRALK